MGIAPNALVWLCASRRHGADFTATATIGRQELLLRERDLADVGLADVPPTGFADDLLRRLGAQTLDVLDASGYEGAGIVHDMNTPLPPELHKRYSVVLDGGSLEHVFNVPVALANSMNMTRPGGHLLLITPANSMLGHGFYQFSPELFYRALSEPYGFRVERMMLAGERRRAWYDVVDPATLGWRGELAGLRPMLLFVRARRTDDQPVDFARAPQQSDYVGLWERNGTPVPAPSHPRLGQLVAAARRRADGGAPRGPYFRSADPWD